MHTIIMYTVTTAVLINYSLRNATLRIGSTFKSIFWNQCQKMKVFQHSFSPWITLVLHLRPIFNPVTYYRLLHVHLGWMVLHGTFKTLWITLCRLRMSRMKSYFHIKWNYRSGFKMERVYKVVVFCCCVTIFNSANYSEKNRVWNIKLGTFGMITPHHSLLGWLHCTICNCFQRIHERTVIVFISPLHIDMIHRQGWWTVGTVKHLTLTPFLRVFEGQCPSRHWMRKVITFWPFWYYGTLDHIVLRSKNQ